MRAVYFLLGGLLFWIPACHSKFKSVVQCPELGSFLNGEVKQDMYNGQRKFKCNSGYKMVGEAKQVCGETGQWQPPSGPVCVQAAVQSGQCIYSGKHYNHGEEFHPRPCVTCACNHGRMMCERQNVCPQLTCPKIDQLQIPGECCPVCKVKRCPLAPTVPHAVYRYRSYPPVVGEGSQILYICNAGYEFVDPSASNLTCHRGAWVGPIPRCVKMQTCQSPPDINAGYFTNSLTTKNIFGSYYIGSKVTYKCHDGFQLMGYQVLECLSSSTWSSIPPQCLPAGETSFYCQNMRNINYGHCKCHQETNTDLQLCQPFYRGVEVECGCKTGYHLEGASLLTCVQSTSNPMIGTWDHEMPYCVPVDPGDVGPVDTYSTGDITDMRSHVSTLVIVIATACSVLGVLLLIMVIVVFRRRKPRPHLFHPGTTPLPYSRVHSDSIDEHDRLALMAYADATRVHLPTYDEATSGHCRPSVNHQPSQLPQVNPTTEFRPLPSIPPTLRTNTAVAGDNTNRHSTVTTSTINRDGTSEIFGSLDTVNVSMSDASTSVTVETYDSGTSMRSIASQEATAGSFTASDDNLANEDVPLLENAGENNSDTSSEILLTNQEQKEE
ncbi:sushi, von Willebrand factor type A, EGF and pentraxin domain-containing protein 1-like isoform X3 [Haliotis rufescens]|uniref:sushi, von Willebrand factor type A, EGF and pentraxin domain-containing protein 1-like isoform X3 n=1 Tax=Haliotis rufescens TaxID=6454 RepID=UPI001EAFAAB7|nr:sushi, von Willebrand factor type A, EGF and pentraxin domain-containing protein 1-like isoform X3 [Haliotis rufescens]